MRWHALIGVGLLLGGLVAVLRLGQLTTCTAPAHVQTARIFSVLSAAESPLSRTLPQDYVARAALCQAVGFEGAVLDRVRFQHAINRARAAAMDPDEQVIVTTYAALVLEKHRFTQEADLHFGQALAISRKAQRHDRARQLLAYLADRALEGDAPSLARAHGYYRQLLSLARRRDDATARILAYSGLYRIARAEGDCDLLDPYRQALPEARRTAIATFYEELGRCDLRRGRFHKARVALEAARSLQEEGGGGNGLASALLAEARLARLQGRLPQAQDLADRAGRILDPGHRGLAARRWAEAGFILAALGNPAQARTHFLLARETLLHGLNATQQAEIRQALRHRDAVLLNDNLQLLEEIRTALASGATLPAG